MLIQTPKKANQVSLELVHILETSACPLSKLPRGEKGKTPWPCRRLRRDYSHTVRDPLLPPGSCAPASSHSQLGDSGGHPAGRGSELEAGSKIGKPRVIDQVPTVLGRSLEVLWFGFLDAAEAGGVNSTAPIWLICIFTVTEHLRQRH